MNTSCDLCLGEELVQSHEARMLKTMTRKETKLARLHGICMPTDHQYSREAMRLGTPLHGTGMLEMGTRNNATGARSHSETHAQGTTGR